MKSKQELLQEDENLNELAPKCLSKWKHSKSGGVYEICGYGFLESTLEYMVRYQCMDTGLVFIRPLAEWEELVSVGEEKVPRFVPHKETLE